MINELESVVLTEDLTDYDLKARYLVVHRGGEGYEVEFIALDGETVAVVTVLAHQVRTIRAREIPHVRSLS